MAGGILLVTLFLALIVLSPLLGTDSRVGSRGWWPGTRNRL
jgi:hypothetical protein